MSPEILAHDAQPLRHSSAADYDAYARAEHRLRCYGPGYVCQHPELLFGRLPVVTPDDRVDPVHRDAPYDPASACTRSGSDHRASGDDDLLMRVVAGYRMLDEIFAPYRAPTRAEELSAKRDMGTPTNTGDQG